MIRSIRSRFIRIALLVLALAIVLVTVIINSANWFNVRSELQQTIGNLCENGAQAGKKGGLNRHMRNTLEESLFFSVIIHPDGSWAFNDISRAAELDDGELQQIVSDALGSGKTSGFVEDHLFSINEMRGGKIVFFLNCETKLTQVRRLALISAAACAGCILLAWLLVSLFSSRAIRPLVENAVRQKQFITDAGHELKTPLTVISANMDVLTLETGQNEWIRSTQKQVANMRALVNELIYLSRLDEEDTRLQKTELDFSNLVRETAEPFIGMAEFSGKTMKLDVEDGLHLTGDEASLKRLVSILCDNAVKYASADGCIEVSLTRHGKETALSTKNSISEALDPETLRHLFDRFYRADASRSKESGGYGIGLSVAKAIVEKHAGTIRVSQDNQKTLIFCCSFHT